MALLVASYLNKDALMFELQTQQISLKPIMQV